MTESPADLTVPEPSARARAFEQLGFGLFVHWGLYSQVGRGEWIQDFAKTPRAEYLRLMETFTAEDFDAEALAQLAVRAGMRYVTLTTRHHDGFSLYDTRGLSDLDVTRTPAGRGGRDLVAEFTDACRAAGLVPMLYHTTLDWNDARFEGDWAGYLTYLRDSIEVLCTHYGPVGGFWFDGNWSKPEADWEEDELYAVIRRHQPEAMVINNTGIVARGGVGATEIDSVTFEQGRPTPVDRRGAPKYLASEMCLTVNDHWGRARHDFSAKSPAQVIQELCFARRAGANLLLNIGPEAQGGLPAYESAALTRVGEWIALHGGVDGVLYGGRPGAVAGQGDDFALALGDELFLFVTGLVLESNVNLQEVADRGTGTRTFTGATTAYGPAVWLDDGSPVDLTQDADRLEVAVTGFPYGTNTVIRIARLTPA